MRRTFCAATFRYLRISLDITLGMTKFSYAHGYTFYTCKIGIFDLRPVNLCSSPETFLLTELDIKGNVLRGLCNRINYEASIKQFPTLEESGSKSALRSPLNATLIVIFFIYWPLHTLI